MRELKTHADYYTMKDVMSMLGKCYQSISTMTQDGRLPEPSYDGRLRVWKKADFDRWIKNEKHLN